MQGLVSVIQLEINVAKLVCRPCIAGGVLLGIEIQILVSLPYTRG